MTVEELLERVTSNPQIMGGEPCIRGTRIPVTLVLDWLASGESMEDILEEYPTLTEDDVRAAIAYGSWSAKQRGHLTAS